jgi:hypothetical protein
VDAACAGRRLRALATFPITIAQKIREPDAAGPNYSSNLINQYTALPGGGIPETCCFVGCYAVSPAFLPTPI